MSQIQEIMGKVREGLTNDHIDTEQVETLIVEINATRWTSERLDIVEKRIKETYLRKANKTQQRYRN